MLFEELKLAATNSTFMNLVYTHVIDLDKELTLRNIYDLRLLLPNIEDGYIRREVEKYLKEKEDAFYKNHRGLKYFEELVKLRSEVYEILSMNSLARKDPNFDLGRIVRLSDELSAIFDDRKILIAGMDLVSEIKKTYEKNIGESLGRYLKHERQSKGLTLAALSEMTGISTSYINRLEKGDRKTPSIQTVQKLSEALNVPLSAFMNVVKDGNKKGSITLSQLIYAHQIKLKEEDEPLSADKKSQILNIIEYISTMEWKDNKVKELSKLMELFDEFYGS